MPEGNGSTARRELSMRAILEALLFAAPEPVGIGELKEAFGEDRAVDVSDALETLIVDYSRDDGGLRIEKIAGGYRITTRPELAEVLREFVRRRNRTRLSRAALETLAVVAYRQPVTAPEVEEIRGVNPSAILKSLLEKRFVRISGRKKVAGNPFLYETTPEFLEHFGLNSVDDLPSLEEFASLLDETQPTLPVPDERAAEPSGPPHPGEAGGD